MKDQEILLGIQMGSKGKGEIGRGSRKTNGKWDLRMVYKKFSGKRMADKKELGKLILEADGK